jgi:U4/U6.U5 tri-snRNP component SNU23
MSGETPVPGGGTLAKQPNFRREWDKAAFEERAKARLAEEETLEEERERAKTAPQPIVQRAPLQRRTEDLKLDTFAGTRQLITGAQAIAGQFAGAYHCKVCDCVLRDSANYLAHINGRKHTRMLGMSMRAERSTVEEVRARLDSHKEQRDASVELTPDQKAEAFLANFDRRIQQREEEEWREAKEKRRAAKSKGGGGATGDDHDAGCGCGLSTSVQRDAISDAAAVPEDDPDRMAMVAMGFDFAVAGFGGSRKSG